MSIRISYILEALDQLREVTNLTKFTLTILFAVQIYYILQTQDSCKNVKIRYRQ